MFDMDYYRAIHGAVGSANAQETLRREIRRGRAQDYTTSIGYVPDALRNGELQPIVATTTNSSYKYDIIAMPEDELCVGDILDFYGEHWIVTDVRSVDVVSLIGTARQCNHLFRWQNFEGVIVERWGVLDSGIYSTTLQDGNALTVMDRQYKIYLPFDDETAKLYIDKRIATEIAYDKNGKQILVVYQITGRDSISTSYGTGGHLLVMNAKSSGDYDPTRDNLELMLCDYITPPGEDDAPTSDALVCEISGRTTLKAGVGARNYTATFFTVDGDAAEGVTPVWTVLPPDDTGMAVYWTETDGVLSLSASEDAIGGVITIMLADDAGLYVPSELQVEVISAL